MKCAAQIGPPMAAITFSKHIGMEGAIYGLSGTPTEVPGRKLTLRLSSPPVRLDYLFPFRREIGIGYSSLASNRGVNFSDTIRNGSSFSTTSAGFLQLHWTFPPMANG